MNKPPAKAATPLIDRSWCACAAAGLLLGQGVMRLSDHHQGAFIGLWFALVFVLCGGASVALFLKYLHAERQRRPEPVPMRTWLLTLSGGLLASIYFDPVLVAA